MKIRKLISILLVGTMLFSLAACGSTENSQSSSAGNTAESEQIELELYTWWNTGEQAAGNAVIEEFEKENPNIKVNVNYIPYENYSSKLNSVISAGETPDIFFIQEYLVKEWGEKGVGMDLAPMYEEIGVKPEEVYVPSAMFKTDEHLWGISPNMTTLLMYYNKNLFQEAGIEPPPADAKEPWTWEEYVEAAKKLTKDTDGKHPGEDGFNYNSVQTFGTMMTSTTSWITLSGLLYSNNTGFANENGTALGITSPEAVEVLQSVADLSLKEQVAPTMGMSKGLQSLPAMLMNDQLGMFIDGAYSYPEFANESYDVGVAPHPVFDRATTMAWASAFMMAKDTEHPEEAFALYRALCDYDFAVEATAKHGANVSNLPNTLSSYENQEKIDEWAKNYNEQYASVTAGLLTETARPGECTALKNFSTIVEQTIMPRLDKLWLGEMTAEEAVKGLDEKLSGELQGNW